MNHSLRAPPLTIEHAIYRVSSPEGRFFNMSRFDLKLRCCSCQSEPSLIMAWRRTSSSQGGATVLLLSLRIRSRTPQIDISNLRRQGFRLLKPPIADQGQLSRLESLPWADAEMLCRDNSALVPGSQKNHFLRHMIVIDESSPSKFPLDSRFRWSHFGHERTQGAARNDKGYMVHGNWGRSYGLHCSLGSSKLDCS